MAKYKLTISSVNSQIQHTRYNGIKKNEKEKCYQSDEQETVTKINSSMNTQISALGKHCFVHYLEH